MAALDRSRVQLVSARRARGMHVSSLGSLRVGIAGRGLLDDRARHDCPLKAQLVPQRTTSSDSNVVCPWSENTKLDLRDPEVEEDLTSGTSISRR